MGIVADWNDDGSDEGYFTFSHVEGRGASTYEEAEKICRADLRRKEDAAEARRWATCAAEQRRRISSY